MGGIAVDSNELPDEVQLALREIAEARDWLYRVYALSCAPRALLNR